MNPGRELDILVHEQVLRLCVHDDQFLSADTGYVYRCRKCGSNGHGLERKEPNPPPYSTDMTAAWKVVEGLRLGGSLIGIVPRPDGLWIVSNTKTLNPRGDGTADDYDDTYPDFAFRVPNPAFGVCIAAAQWCIPEDALDVYLMVCMMCDKTVSQGHTKGCPMGDGS